ncbi:MAG: hypothetical protein R6U52_01505 [Kosmotogaceae bacterium]
MSQIRHQNRPIDDLQKLPIIGRQPKGEKEENFLREICEFEFMNMEEPGLSNRFPYGNSKDSHTFTFFHGGKYKVPRFIAQWVESRTTPIWDWRPDGTGGMQKKMVGNKPRFQMRQVFGG